MVKSSKREKLIAVTLLLVAIYISWRLLLAAAISFADCDDGECDWQQLAGTAVIGRVGDKTTIIPMIEILSKTEYDNGLTENLMRLHRRYDLNREPYIGKIVNAALSEKTASDNRSFLIELLGKITGEKYDCRGHERKCTALREDEKEKRRKARRDFLEWWNKRQAAVRK